MVVHGAMRSEVKEEGSRGRLYLHWERGRWFHREASSREADCYYSYQYYDFLSLFRVILYIY
jgi:hypothetical protein